jgi:hypothetical protein
MTASVHALKPPASRLQLRIELQWIEPVVWRVVLVPETIKLHRLHDVIQSSMGWLDCHLHEFEIGGQRYGTPDPDWDPPGSVIAENRIAFVTALRRTKTCRYVYDFGDGWEHKIKVEKRLAPDASTCGAICVAGEHACPPEDVGGPPGYQHFLKAIADPRHEEHDDMLSWCGGGFDPREFDIELVNRKLRRLRL